MRHDTIATSATSTTCSAALATHVRDDSRDFADGTFRSSNSGQHLSQPLGSLDEAGRSDGERDAEESFPPGAEARAAENHDARVLERAALERCRWDALGERHPDEIGRAAGRGRGE